MRKKIFKMKTSMVASIVVMILLLISLTSATYAWFTFGAATNVEPLSSTISKGDISLLIANQKDGKYAATTPLILNKEVDHLQPVSTADLKHFYSAIGQNEEKISMFFREEKEQDEKVMHGTVYLKCIFGDGDVYFYRDGLNFGQNPQVLAALRLGLHITTQDGQESWWIFKLDPLVSGTVSATLTVPQSDTVVSSIDEDARGIFVKDESVDIDRYMSSGPIDDFVGGRQKLCTIKKDEIATVEYWVYLEGCDENCQNAVQNSEMELQLAFAGVKVSE